MKYFFDNCISFRLADMLKPLGVEVIALREEYPETISDIELFRDLRGKKLVFVTTDTSQVTRKQEARALRECGVTALFFGPFWPKMEKWPQAAWLVAKWPRISGFADNVAFGASAEIKQNGTALPFTL